MSIIALVVVIVVVGVLLWAVGRLPMDPTVLQVLRAVVVVVLVLWVLQAFGLLGPLAIRVR